MPHHFYVNLNLLVHNIFMFINDMFDCISDETNIALYADDTNIWRETIVWDDHLALHNDIENLLRWANMNEMTFHPTTKNVKLLV